MLAAKAATSTIPIMFGAPEDRPLPSADLQGRRTTRLDRGR
jgi:hypothetical protein